jgi:hypothetical protein
MTPLPCLDSLGPFVIRVLGTLLSYGLLAKFKQMKMKRALQL